MSLYSQHKYIRPQLVRNTSYPRRMHGIYQPPPPRKRNNKYALYAAGLILCTVFIAVLWVFPSPETEKPMSDAKASQVPLTPKKEEIKKIDFTPMGAQINAAIAEAPRYETGVAVIDLKTGDTVTYGAPEAFVAASTAKLLTAMAYLKDVDQGKHTLTEPVGGKDAKSALEGLIVESDNVAWDAFNNGILGHPELVALANQIGLENYNAERNTMPPISVAKLLQALYTEKVLSHESTQLLLGYMSRAKEVEHISSIVPVGVKFYHKPGYLSDRVHDATIIDNGKRPYVLVIFSKSRTKYYDPLIGKTLFEKIGQATFETFLRQG